MDKFFNKTIPKKFLVWLVGTIYLPLGWITSDQWIMLSFAYIGGNVVSKMVPLIKALKGFKDEFT
jgi:hypothetical protein